MSGKIEFGVDYLLLMRTLEVQGTPQSDTFDPVDDAAACLFLHQWGFTSQEIDEANQTFIDRSVKGSLPEDFRPVAKRIVDHIKDDRSGQERLVIELAAIGAMDGSVTRDENDYVFWFRDLFDMRPSEFDSLLHQGHEWAVGLNYFGRAFALARGTNSPYHLPPP